jgi:hypothetical protein
MNRLLVHLFSSESRVLFRFSAILFLVYALLGISRVSAQGHQMHDMYPTKMGAEKRDKDLKCTGDFKMGGDWMPCKNIGDYEKSVDKEKR